MNKFTCFRLAATTALVLTACQPRPLPGGTPPASAVQLVVRTQNGSSTFTHTGELIPYNYVITNTGTAPLAGPVSVMDAPRQVTCPELNTVGNLDNNLDLNETIVCLALHTVTQEDVSAGSITNLATATVGGVTSNQAGITLTLDTGQSPGGLQLAIAANPPSYSQIGQAITYSYVITNSGSSPVGPTQFMISHDRLGAPFPCGPSNITLVPYESLACSAIYSITQADMSQASLTSSATASGGGQTSAAIPVTITNLNLADTPPAEATPSATLASAGTLPAPTGVPPIRISFRAGETTTTRIGVVNPNETVRYVLYAVEGQVLSINLTAPGNEVAIAVYDPMGGALKALDTTSTWTTTVTLAGEYVIDIVSIAGAASKSYTLQVGLSPSAVATSETSQP